MMHQPPLLPPLLSCIKPLSPLRLILVAAVHMMHQPPLRCHASCHRPSSSPPFVHDASASPAAIVLTLVMHYLCRCLFVTALHSMPPLFIRDASASPINRRHCDASCHCPSSSPPFVRDASASPAAAVVNLVMMLPLLIRHASASPISRRRSQPVHRPSSLPPFIRDASTCPPS